MSENKNEESIVGDEDYSKNIALSYEYTEKSIKEVQDIINNTNTQLGVLIGFNFTFIRFFLSELPGRAIADSCLLCNSCILLKYLAYSLAIVSIFISLAGLYQTVEFQIINPSALINRCDKASSGELKLAILDLWQNKLNEFKKLAQIKKKRFNLSIACLILSSFTAIVEKIIITVFLLNLSR